MLGPSSKLVNVLEDSKEYSCLAAMNVIKVFHDSMFLSDLHVLNKIA